MEDVVKLKKGRKIIKKTREEIEEYMKENNPLGYTWDDLKDYCRNIYFEDLIRDYVNNCSEIEEDDDVSYEIISSDSDSYVARRKVSESLSELSGAINILGLKEVKTIIETGWDFLGIK